MLLPGAKVDPARYGWFAATLASRGVAVALPKPRGDFARSEDTTGVLAALANDQAIDLDAVMLAGHSAGAVTQSGLTDVPTCQAGFCSPGAQTPTGLRGIILLGWHVQVQPDDDAPLAAAEVPWLVLHGSRDGLTTPEEADASWARISDRPRHRVVVQGMNHFQMTDWVDEKTDDRLSDDLEATIDCVDARHAAAQAIAAFADRYLLRNGHPAALAPDDPRIVETYDPVVLPRPEDHGLGRVASEALGSAGFGIESHVDIVDSVRWEDATYLLVRDDVLGASVWALKDDVFTPVPFPDAAEGGFYDQTQLNGRFGALAVWRDKLWVGVGSGFQALNRNAVGAEVWTWDGTDWEPVISNRVDEDPAVTVLACTWDPETGVATVAVDPSELLADHLQDVADTGEVGATLPLLMPVVGQTADQLELAPNNTATGGDPDPCPSLPAGTALWLRSGPDESGFGDPWNKVITGMEVLEDRLYISTGFNYRNGAALYASDDGTEFEQVWASADHGTLEDGLPISSSISAMAVSDVMGNEALYLGMVGRSGYGARLGVIDANGFEFLIDGDGEGLTDAGFGGGDQQVSGLATFAGRLWITTANGQGFRLQSHTTPRDGATWNVVLDRGAGDPSQRAAGLYVTDDTLWVTTTAQIVAPSQLREGSAMAWRTNDAETFQLVTAHAFGQHAVQVSRVFADAGGLYGVSSRAGLSNAVSFGAVQVYRLTPTDSVDWADPL